MIRKQNYLLSGLFFFSSHVHSVFLLFFLSPLLLHPLARNSPLVVSAFENRFRWIDRLIRAEPSSAPARDAYFINAPWTADARRLFDSIPFSLKKTLKAFDNDVDKISTPCMWALKEFNRQLQPRKRGEEEEEAGVKEKSISMQSWALKSK